MRFFFLTAAPEHCSGPWNPGPELGRHLRALRFQVGEPLLLLPPLGDAVRATFQSHTELELLGTQERPQLPLLGITLATAWPKGPRGDALVQRATENGVTRLIPMACERSVVGVGDFSPARQRRWRKIAQEVCQQSRRPDLPEFDGAPIPLAEIRNLAPDSHPIALVPGTWPLGMELDLHHPSSVLLAVGPEGGFSPEEEGQLRDSGFSFCGLVPTILRIEAAGPLAVGICQHHFLSRQGH
jgi:16S rRNA (uracil1498-N3)-methyltransferase